MNVRATVLAACMSLVAAVSVPAEEPAMPVPTTGHEALAAFLGSWSGSGEMKPGIFGEGGPMSWTEECTWFEGSKFHVACTSEGDSPMGPTKGLGIIGYNAGKKVYTHYGVDNNGWSAYAEGTRDGDTWTYLSEDVVGGEKFHTRATISLVSEKVMTFSWEMSQDGENWTLLFDGKSVKE